MSYHYLNPYDAADETALPNIDIERFAAGELAPDEYGDPSEAGYYYAFGFPGCMPDSEWSGPFDSASEALEDARDTHALDGAFDPRDGSKLGSERYPLIHDEGSFMRGTAYRFAFGACGSTHVIVRAGDLGSALECAMDLLAEHAPGMFVEGECEACRKRYEDARPNEIEWGCAECDSGMAPDMTHVTHTTYSNLVLTMPAIPSWEWSVRDATDAERALYFAEID